MASISKDPNGKKRILFASPDGTRKTLWLGKMTVAQAGTVKQKIERIVAAKITGTALDDETARWIAKLDDSLSQKLSNVGLIQGRDSTLLKPYIDAYVKSRSDVKGSTKTVYGHTRRNLIAFFGENKPLREITKGDAERFRLFLVKEPLAVNTVRRRCGIAKQYFNQAVNDEILSRNPFADLASAVRGNKKREYFVTTSEIEKVIEACPDTEWRLLIALSRFGGLRCPSEHLALRWDDIDWSGKRVTIRSSKTEHHEDGETRVMPLFPELRPYLENAFDTAEDGAIYCIGRYRDSNANLRTQCRKIIKRAGLAYWPKLFHNMRASRQTELTNKHPVHAVCQWLGNSQQVAMKHYLQTTEEHFDAATREPSEKTSQNTSQQSVISNSNG